MERLKTEAPPRTAPVPVADGPPGEPPPELIAACRAGSRAAFEALFEMTHDRVYGLALQLLGNEAAAADASQEVYLKLIERIRQFEGRSRFTTWLHRIVVNTSLDRHRRNRPLLSVEELPEPALEAPDSRPSDAVPDSPEALAMRRESARSVRRAVARLSPRLRQVIVLRFGAGLAYGEIADQLEISIGTVGSRLSRALLRLGRALEGEEAP